MKRRGFPYGFTLVEALVSLAILSAMLLASGLLFSSALRSSERAARDTEAANKLAAVSSMLAGDIRDAVGMRASAQESPSPGSGGRLLFEFLCVERPCDPSFDGTLAVVRVGYRLEGSTLFRAERWIDGQGRAGDFESALSREVADVSVRFKDGAHWLGGWSPGEKGPLPEAVTLSVSVLPERTAGGGNQPRVRRMSLEQVVVPTCKVGGWRKGG